MKTQMRFQKIFMLVSLILAALCVVFALIFCSGQLFDICQLFDSKANNGLGELSHYDEIIPGEFAWLEPTIIPHVATGADLIWKAAQKVSDVLLILGIIIVLVMALQYVMASQKRRNYYITNYIATGIAVAYSLALAIVIIVLVGNCQSVLNSTDLTGIRDVFAHFNSGKDISSETWMFGLGYALAALLIVDAIGFVLNLLWKLKLMQGEKKLLERGLVKEVA